MSKKKITIASPRGIIIPAAILGLENDYSAGPHEPVSVPEDYGSSLIENRFAAKVDDAAVKPKVDEKPKTASKAKATGKQDVNLTPATGSGQLSLGDETLLGSNVQPSIIEISDGRTIQLGEAVSAAHKNSGLSVADWNAQPEDVREAAILAAIEQIKVDASNDQSQG